MAFPCGHPRPPPLQPAPLAFTVASRAGSDWEYYSTAFSIAPGAVYHKQQQKAPYAAPAGALGVAAFAATLQEERDDTWTDVAPDSRTYLHHFTMQRPFISTSIGLSSRSIHALPCRNNPMFEAGNGGSGATRYRFGRHYVADDNNRHPSYPGGNISVWLISALALNTEGVQSFWDAAQCRCAPAGRGRPYWQDSQPAPPSEDAHGAPLVRRTAAPAFPPSALNRSAPEVELGGAIACCVHGCAFPTRGTLAPRRFRFRLRLTWARPEQRHAAALLPVLLPAFHAHDSLRRCDFEFNLAQHADAETTSMTVELQAAISVAAIVPHCHVRTTELLLEAMAPGGAWETLCGGADNVEFGAGFSRWRSPPCEFSDAPLKLRRGTRLRSRHRHDTRGHAVLGAMSAFTLLVEVPAPMRAATPILPALREAVRREYGLESGSWPPL